MIQQIVCLFVCGIVNLAVASNSKFIKYEFVTLQFVLIAKWLLQILLVLHGFYQCTLFTFNFSLVIQANDFTS